MRAELIRSELIRSEQILFGSSLSEWIAIQLVKIAFQPVTIDGLGVQDVGAG